ncbi:hypothetical protein ACVWW1_000001, partial [Bradyrhizobium sp. JR3.5]
SLKKTLVNSGERLRNLLPTLAAGLGAMPHCGWRIRENFLVALGVRKYSNRR